MNQQPFISICIANYNGMSVIDDCIQSILQQISGLEIEILVHDDASTDESVAHIRKFYPDIQLLESDKNVGFCIANNRMASIARGEYLLLLNNDAALYPDALITLHRAAVEIGRPAILGLPQYKFDTGELLDIGSLFDPFLNPVPNKNSQRGDVAMVMGACLWIPKVLWDEIGGFPEWFHTLTEDMYLCFVALVYGYNVNVLNTSGFKHWVGKSLGGGKVKRGKLETTYKRRRMSERNKTFVMLLCLPSIMLAAILPIHLVLLLFEGILLSIIKRDKEIWSSIYSYTFESMWVERKRLLRERKRIQNRRSIRYREILSIFIWYPYKLKMLVAHGLPNLQ
ncbi:MAG: glycosyltransferase [Sedimenticola sp.]